MIFPSRPDLCLFSFPSVYLSIQMSDALHFPKSALIPSTTTAISFPSVSKDQFHYDLIALSLSLRTHWTHPTPRKIITHVDTISVRFLFFSVSLVLILSLFVSRWTLRADVFFFFFLLKESTRSWSTRGGQISLSSQYSIRRTCNLSEL